MQFHLVKDKNGQESYSRRSEISGKTSSMAVQNQGKGSQADDELFLRMSKNWKIGLFEQSHSSSSGSATTPATTLMLKDMKQCLKPKQWLQAKAQLEQALSAFEKGKVNGKSCWRKLAKTTSFTAERVFVQNVFRPLCLCNMLS